MWYLLTAESTQYFLSKFISHYIFMGSEACNMCIVSRDGTHHQCLFHQNHLHELPFYFIRQICSPQKGGLLWYILTSFNFLSNWLTTWFNFLLTLFMHIVTTVHTFVALCSQAPHEVLTQITPYHPYVIVYLTIVTI